MVACFWLDGIGIACERSRLPHLAEQPIALAGEDDLLRAVSSEARAYGVRPGQAIVFAKSLCQGLIVLPYDLAAYTDSAEAVWDGVASESGVVEPLSPELVYAWMTGTDIPQRLQTLALSLADRSKTEVRAGLGRSKLVARQAARSRWAAEGVVVAGAGAREEALIAPVALAALAVLPAKVRARALRIGVGTLGDVMGLPPAEIDRQFKECGALLRRLAAGDDGDPVKAIWPPKGIEQAIAFDDEVGDEHLLHQALEICAHKIAARLSLERTYCRTLALTVCLEGGESIAGQEPLASPARDSIVLERASRRLLGRLMVDRPVLGITLKASRLTSGASAQLALLSEDENGLTYEQREKLTATLAHLKGKFGIAAVTPGRLLRRAQRIHLWTYRLGQVKNEPVEVVTDPSGAPVRIYRAAIGGRPSVTPVCYEVRWIQNSWREADWLRGELSEMMCYRVLTEPDGLYELHHRGTNWRLCAVYD
ncbi:MAG: hypothetical protein P4L33_04500 [Capsulimonadaceae bacterium]|nr:hypothetical protein [Capsulimonadaceae bacterium]